MIETVLGGYGWIIPAAVVVALAVELNNSAISKALDETISPIAAAKLSQKEMFAPATQMVTNPELRDWRNADELSEVEDYKRTSADKKMITEHHIDRELKALSHMAGAFMRRGGGRENG